MKKIIPDFQIDKPKYSYILIACIIIITLFKLSLAGSGFLTWPDEYRYYSSRYAFDYLRHLELKSATKEIFSIHGRPGDGILKIIPNSFQWITSSLFSLERFETKNTIPLFIYNYFIYILILIVHYRISYLLIKDKYISLLGVLILSVLTNSYLYLKHALPYDASLLILYYTLYKICYYRELNVLTLKKTFFLGIIGFSGFLVYPGYFPLFLISPSILLLKDLDRSNFVFQIKATFAFGFGALFLLTLTEVSSRWVGLSYIQSSLDLSKTVDQGSFEESFSFIIKYLFQVEGITGILLTIFLFLFYFIIFKKFKVKHFFNENSTIVLLGTTATILFLIYSFCGYFFHSMVLYGRLLHQYFPLICIFSLFAFQSIIIKNKQKNYLFIYLLLPVIILNFGYNFFVYSNLAFPRDVAWEILKKSDSQEIENLSEYENSFAMAPSEKGEIHFTVYSKDSILSRKILLINCCHFYPIDSLNKFHLFNPENKFVLLSLKPHYQNFKAYQFEGYNISARKIIDLLDMNVKVFQRNY